MRDNLGVGEVNLTNDVHRDCKKKSSVLSCIDKKKNVGCDRGSEVWTVQSERNEKEPVSLRKLKESDRRDSFEKDFVSR